MHNAFVLAGIFMTSFVVALSGALMPGPLLAITINESLRRGALAGPLIIIGHIILEAMLVAAVALGPARFLTDTVVTTCIGPAGGVLMIWMGFGTIRSAGAQTVQGKPNDRRLNPIAAGIVISLANPYWIAWWATIGAGYILMGMKFGIFGVTVFFLGHIIADAAWYTLVSIGVSRGKNFLSDTLYRRLLICCGIALLCLGVWFAWGSLRTASRLLRESDVGAVSNYRIATSRPDLAEA